MSEQLLFLSEPDTIQCGVLDSEFCIGNAAEVFKLLEVGDFLFGGESGLEHGHRFVFPKESPLPGFPIAGPDRRFMSMLGYVGGRFHAIGQKWYGINVNNIQKGLPRANHMIVLNDFDTGVPTCIMMANLVSAMRSGAVPALAASALASSEAQVVGILGAGLLNRATLPSLKAVLPNLKEVKVHDVISERSEAYCKEMSEQLNIEVYPVADTEAAVRGSDVIHAGVAGKIVPHIKREWLNDNALLIINSVVNYDEKILYDCNVVFDLFKSHEAWYDSDPNMWLPPFTVVERLRENKLKRENILDLGPILSGACSGAVDKNKPSIFMFLGMPVLDVALAYDLYNRALDRNIGTKLNLWDAPYWY